MENLEAILRSHPRTQNEDPSDLVEAIKAVVECAQVCAVCADSCLAEPKVETLVRCIREDLDCADVCEATARVLSRRTEPTGQILRAQLQACVAACRICAEECERHKSMHEHCRICAETCQECAETCELIMKTIRVTV